jgi:cytochrome c553
MTRNHRPLTLRWAFVLGTLLTGSLANAQIPDTMAQRALACTGCHGEQGRSRPDGYVPRLAGKPAGYLHEQLLAFRDGRRPHQRMAALLEHLDEPMLTDLAAHFAGQDLPYPPPAQRAPAEADARRAAQLVQDGDPGLGVPACASCHGAALTGIAPQVPGLLGLPADYLLGQLGAWREGHRRARAPDCMAEVAHRLPPEDLGRLARWLAAQPVPRPSSATTQVPARWPLRCGSVEPPSPAPPRAPETLPAEVARGAYLARVGNCAGCHTAPGGADLAGGVGIPTPFGTVYAGNLTPDPGTGLGRWRADDFWRALHEGRSRDGRRLAPAFPYPSYTHLTRADSDALFAYLRSLPAVVQPQRAHSLRFPFGTQAALAVWQALSFTPGDPAAVMDRGEYLVRGLGHCGECHAPRNRWGAAAATLDGGVMPAQGWYAPPLRPPAGRPLDVDATVQLLRSGRHAGGTASGPMAGVVGRSTQHWQDADLRAAAAYLAALPPLRAATGPIARAPAASLALGRRLYADRCADCHGAGGQGVPGVYPPLAGNPTVLAPEVHNLVQLLRHGGFAPSTRENPRPYGMPPQDLTVTETTALINHLRQAWAPHAGAVAETEVLRVP